MIGIVVAPKKAICQLCGCWKVELKSVFTSLGATACSQESAQYAQEIHASLTSLLGFLSIRSVEGHSLLSKFYRIVESIAPQ